MSTVGLLASVLLGATFLLAGGAKLAAGAAWRAQARDLGAPAMIAPVIPWLELVVGAALIVQLAQPLAATVAIVMLVAFSGLIGVHLLRGRRPPCACFGAWSASPIGLSHLVRNGVLVALGVLALAA